MAKVADVKNKDEFVEGQAYFCPECNRTHTKGKIYKEHLEYAQTGKSNEDSKENDINDEQELIEAFNEIEKEISENEVDAEEEEEINLILDDNDDTLEDSVKAVKKLPGVGEATLNKLIKAGFNSLESIAYTPPKIIKDESGLGDKTIEKLVKASMEQLGLGFKSAEALW